MKQSPSTTRERLAGKVKELAPSIDDVKELGFDKMGITSPEDLQRFLQDFISNLQRRLSQDLESLLGDVLKMKESKHGVFSKDDLKLLRFPGVTVLEKGSFQHVSVLGITVMETKRGTFVPLPFVKIMDSKLGSIVKLSFITVMDLDKKGTRVNLFGFTIDDLKLDLEEPLESDVSELVNSFKVRKEDFQPRKKRKRQRSIS